LGERARPALIEVDESTGEMWERLTLKHEFGPEIAVVEKNPVVEGELGAEKLSPSRLLELPARNAECCEALGIRGDM
jgi:hypothetical protein